MSNAVGVIGLVFSGTDLQSADLHIHLEITRGLNDRPVARGIDLIVPSRAGRIIRNRFGDNLTIGLHGWVGGATKSAFRTNAKTVRALFDPTAEPASLVATLEDGTTATISARTLATSLWTQITPDLAEVDYELESVDPDWVIT